MVPTLQSELWLEACAVPRIILGIVRTTRPIGRADLAPPSRWRYCEGAAPPLAAQTESGAADITLGCRSASQSGNNPLPPLALQNLARCEGGGWRSGASRSRARFDRSVRLVTERSSAWRALVTRCGVRQARRGPVPVFKPEPHVCATRAITQ